MTAIEWQDVPGLVATLDPTPHIPAIAIGSPVSLIPGATVTPVAGGVSVAHPEVTSVSGTGYGIALDFALSSVPDFTPDDAGLFRFAFDLEVAGPVTPGKVTIGARSAPAASGPYALINRTLVEVRGDPAAAASAAEIVRSEYAPPGGTVAIPITGEVAATNWLHGATPYLSITALADYFMAAVTLPANTYTVRNIRLQRQVATAPEGPPPSELHFRDPADGLFKPLTGIEVRGFPAAEPDYSLGQIAWGSSQFPITVDTTTVPAAVAAGMNGPIPPENNPAISVADGVFRFTMTGSATGQSLGTGFWISITDLPESLPIDARRYRFAADVKVNSMVGVVSMSFNVYPARQGAQAVVGLPMPTPATAPNFTDFAPVYQDFPPDRLPTLLAGADPSIYIIMTVGGLMSAGTGGPIDVEIRNIRLEAQEVVAP